MAKTRAPPWRPLLDDLPAVCRQRLHSGIERFPRVEIEEDRLDLRICFDLRLASRDRDAWRSGIAARGQSLVGKGKVWRIGDIGREISKTRQAHRLLHEIGGIGQKQSGENEPCEGLPGALAPAAPNYRKSQ